MVLPASLARDLHRGQVRRRIPFLGYPPKGKETYKPFFIVGVARSGNTLLRRILTSENTVATMGDVPEWFWHKQVREPISASNPGKGRYYFSAQEKRELQQLIGEELELRGYLPCAP